MRRSFGGSNERIVCHHCTYLSKDLDIYIDAKHDPKTCRRRRKAVKNINAREDTSDSGCINESYSLTKINNLQREMSESSPVTEEKECSPQYRNNLEKQVFKEKCSTSNFSDSTFSRTEDEEVSPVNKTGA